MNGTNTQPLVVVDTLVIGGGTGGAAFAATLATHSDETVLLVESGHDYGPRAEGRWPTDVLDARFIPLSHDYELHTANTSGQRLDLPRARIVGGCSAHNGCTASVGARFDYDDWATQGNPGWSADEVEPLLKWVVDKFHVRRYRMDELTPPQKAFVEAGMLAGLPFADDLDSLAAAEGIGPMAANVSQDGIRYNSAFAFLDEVRDQANFAILADSTVTKIQIEEGRVTGVFVRRPEGDSFIAAARVVLAAGAYHSPALLLRSGIGPADELTALGIQVEIDRPGVGKHLLDHSCIKLDFAGRPGLSGDLAQLPWNPDEQTVGRAKSSRCDDGPYDIHVFMVAGANTGHPGLPPITLYGGAMRARSEGTVTLNAELDIVRPVIDHRYGTDPEGYDRHVLAESLELLEQMVAQPALSEILGERVRAAGPPLDNIVNYCHPAGTCKMGPTTDPFAVVDHTGRIHGASGLFVADASIMPAITRGNINLPTAMIGARIAAGLLGLSPKTIPANATPTTPRQPR